MQELAQVPHLISDRDEIKLRSSDFHLCFDDGLIVNVKNTVVAKNISPRCQVTWV